MALLNRLKSDRSLSAFAGQFVPLKLTTSNNPEWGRWFRQYGTEGKAIPFLYVVRADGQRLFRGSGPMEGPQLPQMLYSTLQQAGRTFNDAEVQLLAGSVEQAKAALESGDQTKAVVALGQLQKLGNPSDLKSYSTLAKQAEELVKKVTESGQASIDEAKAKLEDPQTSFEGVLTLVEAERVYEPFPALNTAVVSALRDVRKDSTLKPLALQAEALDRARRYASSDSGAVKRRAENAYEQVIRRFPGTPAAETARAELVEIDPDSPVLSETSGQSAPSATAESAEDGFRIWTDITGKYKTKAKLLGTKDGKVALRKTDGKTVILPISKLCEADQALLRGE